MVEERKSSPTTLALSTKVEEDFVAPLTAVRGSLEILRDFNELTDDERQRFLDTALRGCTKLEKAVEDLAATVYSAGQQAHAHQSHRLSSSEYKEYEQRIKVLNETDTIEVDFSNFEFSSAKIVNDFYDVIDELVESSGRKWYFLVNYANSSIWPEAWVAFAHRGKKVNVNYSLGTVRYAASQDPSDRTSEQSRSEDFDPNLFTSREAALAKIEEMKAANTKSRR